MKFLSRLSLPLAVAALLMAPLPAAASSSTPPNGASVSYSATSITPPPPAGSFEGSAGGDGWGLSFYNGNVYNIFHHQHTLQLQCHVQSTAAICAGFPKTIVDTTTSDNFSTSDTVSMYINATTGTMYTWVTDDVTFTAGVVSIDLNSTADNPFVSFVPTSGTGEAPYSVNHSGISRPIVVDNKWYAMDWVITDTPTGTENQLMCFDLVAGTNCGAKAIPGVSAVGPTTSLGTYIEAPGITQWGDNIIIDLANYPASSDADGKWYCMNVKTGVSCGGAWPIAFPANARLSGAGFPVVSPSTLEQVGVCFETYVTTWDGSSPSSYVAGHVYCYNQAGAPLSAASASATAAIDGNGTTPYIGAPVVLGTRVYLAQGDDWGAYANSNWDAFLVCYDWSTNKVCPNFPIDFNQSQLYYLYTVTQAYPNSACLWLNADRGSAQIQTLDAYTAGPCAGAGTRIEMGQFVQPVASCTPTTYTSLTVSDPVPSAYQNGTVTFEDASGNPLPNVPVQHLVDGTIDLRSLNLSTAVGLPQMLMDLPGAQAATITMDVKWTAPYHAECTANGQKVTYDVLAKTGSNTGTIVWLGVAAIVSGAAMIRRRSVRSLK